MGILSRNDLSKEYDIRCFDGLLHKDVCTFSVKRIIHPIGQGAFYTERLNIGEVEYNVVYDCGSLRRSKVVQTEVNSYYEDGDVIDILFISHFDNDHINGLLHLKKKCVIRNVVMPLIDGNHKWVYLSRLDASLRSIITEPEVFFRDAKLIWVKTFNSDEDGSESYVIDQVNEAQAGQSVEIINSGTRIYLKGFSDWCYIPFNFDEKSRYDKLVNELLTAGIDISLLENDNIEYIIQNTRTINDCYKRTMSDGSNKTSLVLYSGPTNNEFKFEQNIFCSPKIIPSAYIEHLLVFREVYKSCVACLYLGDTDLNQRCSSYDILDAICSTLRNLTQNIGLVQLPHHGAIKNYNPTILSAFNHATRYFASFGRLNGYGHPSARVVEEVSSSNIFYPVREERDSMIVDIINRV
ncbi:MAG: MBL fold metallo-hydrolase [Alistipes sp.]|nr:MBL fold metallo-hydrolase [Alistipes sp.]